MTAPFTTLEEEDRAGVHSVEIHFPQTYVSQAALERDNGVPAGKFTIGLGQTNMAFVSECEDVCSLALTVVSRLLEREQIDPKEIGRLTVSTESQIDHSKSIKSSLMQLFQKHGNNDIEGCDYIHACYSGTQAVFDAITWCEGRDWDGRYAIVVAVDIAEYAKGPARPTGGAGAFAALISRKPAIYLEPLRASYMSNEYDFYKPNMASPFPVVDGKHSNKCFAESFDRTYRLLDEKYRNKLGRPVTADEFDYFICHAPYHKLVRKTFSRIFWNDFLIDPNGAEKYPALAPYKSSPGPDQDRPLYKELTKTTQPSFDRMGAPACTVSKEVGNVYSASLWLSLASLCGHGTQLAGKRILSFSYGSGLCSTSFVLRGGTSPESLKLLERMGKNCQYSERLKARTECSPEVFNAALARRESLYTHTGEFKPEHLEAVPLLAGSYFLEAQDKLCRRTYAVYGTPKPTKPMTNSRIQASIKTLCGSDDKPVQSGPRQITMDELKSTACNFV